MKQQTRQSDQSGKAGKVETKVAIVTGAGSGIGRSVALALLNEGFLTVLAGRRPAALQATQAAAGRPGEYCIAIPTDVTRPESVHALFATVKETHGRLDLLFNNAGTNVPATAFEDLSYEQWKMVLDTNLTGAFLCAQQAFRMMKDQRPQGGRIINNGSISAQIPRPHSAPYTASKFGVSGLTRAIALDGRAYNICCGQIDIGNASTEMTTKMTKGVLQANGSIATEPTIAVDHVVQAVLYMAGLPLAVNVPFMTVMANQMPFIGRG